MQGYQSVIKQITAGHYASLYLFFGEEKYLQEELITRLEEAFLGEEKELNCEKIDGTELALDQVLEKLDEIGLFSRRRLIILENPPYLVPPRKTDRDDSPEEPENTVSADRDRIESLERYLQDKEPHSSDAILVITTPKVDRRKKIFKLIDQKGVAVECNQLKGELLSGWINNKVKTLGKSISREALDRLLMAEDHNLHYLSTELEKYALFLGEHEHQINGAVVDRLFSGDIQGDVFKLADALAGNNLVEADRLLTMLLGRREKALQIFFMLVRHYRLLLKTRCLLDEGLPQSQFPAVLEVQHFVARRLREQAVLFDRKTLEEAMIVLQSTDSKIKTGKVEPIQALYLLINRIVYLQLVTV